MPFHAVMRVPVGRLIISGLEPPDRHLAMNGTCDIHCTTLAGGLIKDVAVIA